MPRKKIIKAKEPIRIRFKELNNGNKSIYLDCYIDGKRSYEFLKLYIIPDSCPDADKLNANTLQAANAIKAARLIEVTNGKAGVTKSDNKSKILLSDYMQLYRERKEKTGQSDKVAKLVTDVSRYLTAFKKGEGVQLCDVDKQFCTDFVNYLNDKARTKFEKPLAKGTIGTLFAKLNAALNQAVTDGLIPANPISQLDKDVKKRVRGASAEREYLTVDEVKVLTETPMYNNTVKSAFLFSCFCGLRISDIYNLKWSDLHQDGDKTFVRITMQKTSEPITVPLSDEALKWLPERNKSAKEGDKVFKLPALPAINDELLTWCTRAGITKHISFHTARHSFATSLLTAGADLYTTSKLLGHSNITTTQIYAKIIDTKKVEAVNLLDNLFRNNHQLTK